MSDQRSQFHQILPERTPTLKLGKYNLHFLKVFIDQAQGKREPELSLDSRIMARKRLSGRRSSKKSKKNSSGTSYLPIVVLNANEPSSRHSYDEVEHSRPYSVTEDGEHLDIDEVEVYDGSLYDFNKRQDKDRYRSRDRRPSYSERRYRSPPRRVSSDYSSSSRPYSQRRRHYSPPRKSINRRYYSPIRKGSRSPYPREYHSSNRRSYSPELTSESQRPLSELYLPRSYPPHQAMPGAYLQRRNGPDGRWPPLRPRGQEPNQMFASYARDQQGHPNPMIHHRPFGPPQMPISPNMMAAQRAMANSGGGGGFDLFEGNNIFFVGAIAVALFFLNKQLADGDFDYRRKRDVDQDQKRQHLHHLIRQGLEDFEGKIEKIAGGVDKDENSWLNKLYKQYNGETLSQTLSEQADEAATSEDEQENRAFRKKRANEEVIEKEDNAIKAIYDNVENTCSTKFWRCISNVVEGGIQYSEMPGGLTGAMKKHLMKVVFAGGISNMWESLMTVPEARKFQKCMSKQRECNEYQVLRRALNSEQTHPQRLLVVPEAVEIQEEDQE